ncbi:hypothetical protein NLI96_g9237 [Meripilus lineatus]|uniref:Alpha-galactosidase n=1 Tax=Meripilus lineatus TaxID=2056292 RepID=A0AAD5UXJ9_9APHY|nr:hypothetical protein NLI96_g9237 [Physisporinus lineatus]
MLLLSALLTFILHASKVRGLDNGLAITPQMGWNTYNHFGCDISETSILNTAKAMVANNLTKLGYEYVLIDDCWQAPARDPNTGAPVANSDKFPRGIKALADDVHALGMKVGQLHVTISFGWLTSRGDPSQKFGIYSNAGKLTCGSRFGSLGHEEIDAKTYAEWGVDYLKYDNCYNEGQAGTPKLSFDRFAAMSYALNATGRPILYSVCNWGEDGPWNFAPTIANSWRISGDIMDNFGRFDERCPCTSALDCKLPGFNCAMARIIDFAAPLGQKARQGAWNDLDMLEIGNGGMTYDEYVSHFTFWSILKSPLILGNDITNMSPETLEIITNKAIIDINQDPAASPATRRWKRSVPGGDLSLWSGSLVNYRFIFALLNTSPKSQTVDIDFTDVFVDQGTVYQHQPYALSDLWQKDASGNWGKPLGTFQGSLSKVVIGSHQTKIWMAVPAP